MSPTCPRRLKWVSALRPCAPLPILTSRPPAFANRSPVIILRRILPNGPTAQPCCLRPNRFHPTTTAARRAPRSLVTLSFRPSTGGALHCPAARRRSSSACLTRSPRSPSSSTQTSPATTSSHQSATSPATRSATHTPPLSSNASWFPRTAPTIRSSGLRTPPAPFKLLPITMTSLTCSMPRSGTVIFSRPSPALAMRIRKILRSSGPRLEARTLV